MVVVPRKQRSKDKLVNDRKALASILSGLMTQGKTVVLTNGVFDLLHVGHVRCLEDAKARGDFLVVAVNDDKSTEKIKGKGHPVVPHAERMEMLTAFWFVDYVTGMQEDTADRILEILKPSLYAKGTEYNTRTLPERNTVKELGIKTVFVGDKKGHSSSKIIQKIKRRKSL